MGYRRLVAAAVAVLAAALTAPAAATAAPPEFTGSFPNAFTATSKATTLETVAKVKIKCTADSASGSITGAKTLSIKLRLTGCSSKNFPGLPGTVSCQSPVGAPPGEIDTASLSGALGYISAATVPKEVGFELSNPFAAVIAHYQCGTFSGGEIDGSVIGKVTPVNKTIQVAGQLALKFVQKAGVQAVSKLEGGAVAQLGMSVLVPGLYEIAGLNAAETLKFAAPFVIIA